MTHEIAHHTNGQPPGHTNGQALSPANGQANTLATTQPSFSLSNFDDLTPVKIEAGGLNLTLTVRDVLDWIAPGAPKTEALKFLVKCRMFGLNPLADEIYLLPMGPKWQVIIAKSGYLKLANNQPAFAGFDAGILIQKVIDAKKGEFGDPKEFEGACVPRGWIVCGGWCRVYRTDRARPVFVSVGQEYYKSASQAWKDNSPTMYRKVAISQAIREAFPLGGSYDETEFEGVVATPKAGEVAARREEYARQEHAQIEARPEARPEPEVIEAEVIETPRVEPVVMPTPPTATTAPIYDWPESSRKPVTPETLAALTKMVTDAELTTEEIAGMLGRRGVHSGRMEDLSEMHAQDCLLKLGAELTPFPWEVKDAEATEATEADEAKTTETTVS